MSRKIRSESELRRQVQKILGFPVAEWAWKVAVLERAVSEVLQGENTPEWLAQKLQQWMDVLELQTKATPEFIIPNRRQRRGETTQVRREALSEALAAIARQSEEVLSFRSKILRGRILQFQEIEKWIEEHRQDATYPHALLIRIKRDSSLFHRSGRQSKGCLRLVGPDEIEGPAPVDSLFYAKPGSICADAVPVGRDGTLRIVQRISKTLAGRFLWQEAQATVFLLADLTPLITTQSIQFGPPPFMKVPDREHLLPMSCLTRVIITIDPMKTPRELSQEYGRVRTQLLGRKPRSQSEKHLQLALFAVKHQPLDKEAMAQWGTRFPKWKYTRLSLFSRDARVARERLLHEHPVDPWRKRHD